VKATIYLTTWCPFCVRAKELLEARGIPYEEHVLDDDRAREREVKEQYGHHTVPIILLDGEFIGGCDELMALDRAGGLA
jgi:glutaredoxin 3